MGYNAENGFKATSIIEFRSKENYKIIRMSNKGENEKNRNQGPIKYIISFNMQQFAIAKSAY